MMQMRKKLILILIIIALLVVIVNVIKNKNIFIQNKNQIEMLSEKNFKETDSLLKTFSPKEQTKNLPGIIPKYEVLDSKTNLQYCNKKSGTVLISQEEGYDIVSYGDNNDFSYYKVKGKSCELIGSIKDIDFQVPSNEIYANDSIYGVFESLSDYNVHGLIRIDKEGITTLDTIDSRFTNPLNINGDVLTIENYRNIVIFNENNQIIAKQDNTSKNREILAVNKAGDSLLVLVKHDNKYYLEGYDSLELSSIEKGKPLLTYDLGDKFKVNDSTKFVTINDSDFAVFKTQNQTLIAQNDLSKIILLEKNYDIIDLFSKKALAKFDETYYILDFNTMQKEKIGNLKSVALKISKRNLYFVVLDDKNKEIYIKFTVK